MSPLKGADTDEVDLTIVVPCYNEEANIADTLDTLAAAMRHLPPVRYEILVIDDGSKDATVQVVEAYAQIHTQMPIVLRINPRNRGLTRTYVDGAFVGRGNYYRLVCGDNVEPAETLVKVFSLMGQADMVIPYHEAVPGKSALRRGVSGVYTGLVNALSGYHIRYYNGLALHRRYNVMRWGPYSFGFGFQAELITRLLDEGATYIEVAVAASHQEKNGGQSALNWKNFVSVAHTLMEVAIRRIRKHAFRI
jgi:glycosyltransferase involved in cell wall biosynthesis